MQIEALKPSHMILVYWRHQGKGGLSMRKGNTVIIMIKNQDIVLKLLEFVQSAANMLFLGWE